MPSENLLTDRDDHVGLEIWPDLRSGHLDKIVNIIVSRTDVLGSFFGHFDLWSVVVKRYANDHKFLLPIFNSRRL